MALLQGLLPVEGHPNERSPGWWQQVITGKTHRRCIDTLPSDQEGWMMKIKTSPYNVAETLRTPSEMAAYLEACIEEVNRYAAFVATAWGDSPYSQGMMEIAALFLIRLP
jgi:hypothetical protein